MSYMRRISSLDKIYHFKTEIEINAYHYTAGPVGTRWLEALKNGELKVAKCNKCGTRFLPPKLYCPKCFSEVSELESISGEGYIDTYSVIYYNDSGERMPEPVIIALIRFEGIYGGIIHKVKTDPKKIRIGMRVKPVFRRDKKGSIDDIEYFQPIE